MSATVRRILWFRNDLRLHDNPLFEKCSSQDEVLCVYFADPSIFSGKLRETGLPKVGLKRASFLRESVEDLRRNLRGIGGDLLVATELPEVFLPRLAISGGSLPSRVEVMVAQGVTPEEQSSEARVETSLATLGIPSQLVRVWGLSLYHIDDLPYQDIRRDFPMVFAPFGRAVRGNFRAADAAAVGAAKRGLQGVQIRPELPEPKRLSTPKEDIKRMSVEDLKAAWPQPPDLDPELVPVKVHAADPWWDRTFRGGEQAGLHRLSEFIAQDLARYKETRNGLIGKRFSSKLSPWVAAGCVSPRRIAAEIHRWEIASRRGQPTPSSAHYLSEYGWRDYLIFMSLKCGSSLFHLRGPGKVDLPWVRNRDMENRLLQGRIGMPLIDAAVREVAASGFLSNRARQFVASYIIMELKLDWRVGAELFESQLVDYDVHANWGNWMRAAGVSGQGFGHGGSRWFNLAEERDRFDSSGDYVRLWLPELKQVPRKFIHAPWSMSKAEQSAAGISIGVDYPEPPDTPSKHALDGSASAEDLAPEWFATTKFGKSSGHHRQPSRNGKGGRSGSGKASGKSWASRKGSLQDQWDFDNPRVLKKAATEWYVGEEPKTRRRWSRTQ